MYTMHNDNESIWTFLTNHAHVLLCLVNTPDMLMKDIAREVGITERAVQRIIADLRSEGYIVQERHGRRNSYTIQRDRHLKHPIEAHKTISDLIQLIFDSENGEGHV
jgi:predicted transcriptional regulator